MSYIITINRRTQVFYNKSLHIDKKVKKDLKAFFGNKEEFYLVVLNYLISIANNHRFIWVSVETISKNTGVSARQIARILNELREHNVIKTLRRGFNETNFYKIASDFFDFSIRDKLKGILKALGTLSFFSLSGWIYNGILSAYSSLSVNGSLSINRTSARAHEGDQFSLNSQSYCEKIELEEKETLSTRNTTPIWVDSLTSDRKQVDRNGKAPDFSALLNPNKKYPCKKDLNGKDVMSKPHNVTQLPMNICKCLRSISSDLRLTRWGQIKFMAFIEDVLIIAYGKYKKSRHTGVNHNKFEYLFALCLKECSLQDIAPDWDKMNRLATRFNMKADAPMTLQAPKLKRSTFVSSVRTFDVIYEHGAFEANRSKMHPSFRNMRNPYEHDMDRQRKIFDEPSNFLVDSEVSEKTNVELPASTILNSRDWKGMT